MSRVLLIGGAVTAGLPALGMVGIATHLLQGPAFAVCTVLGLQALLAATLLGIVWHLRQRASQMHTMLTLLARSRVQGRPACGAATNLQVPADLSSVPACPYCHEPVSPGVPP